MKNFTEKPGRYVKLFVVWQFKFELIFTYNKAAIGN